MPISSKTTVAQSFFYKIYQKQPIEVPKILLTTKTNKGKLKVARSFLAQPNLMKEKNKEKNYQPSNHSSLKELSK